MAAAISLSRMNQRQGMGEQKCAQRRLRASVRAACPKARKRLHTQPERFRNAYRREERRGSPLCKKQRCMRKCRLCRKRAKSACEGCCNADGKDVEQEKQASHSGSAGVLRKNRGGGEGKEREKPAETECFSGFGRSINLLGRLQIFGWFVGNGLDRSVRSDR